MSAVTFQLNLPGQYNQLPLLSGALSSREVGPEEDDDDQEDHCPSDQ